MKLRKLRSEVIIGLVAAALLLFAFAELAEGVLADELTQFDSLIGGFIRGYISDTLTPVALFFTYLGTAYVYGGLTVVACGFLWFRRHQQRESVVLLISLLGSWILNTILKELFHRSRPDISRLAEAGGYSFPSGHAMVSASFYGMLSYLLWREAKRKSRPAGYIPVLTTCLVLLIGISRIYLGVHYPSDVIAGFAAGSIWLLACIAGLDEIQPKRN